MVLRGLLGSAAVALVLALTVAPAAAAGDAKDAKDAKPQAATTATQPKDQAAEPSLATDKTPKAPKPIGATPPIQTGVVVLEFPTLHKGMPGPTLLGSQTVSFDKAFRRPPQVVLSVIGAKFGGSADYYVRPRVIGNDGFTVELWAGGDTSLERLVVQWMAFLPQAGAAIVFPEK